MKKSIFFIVIVAICALDCSISSAQNYDELITRSFDYLDADSLPEAEEALREALRIEPGNPGNGMLLLNLGTIQRRQGKLKEAEESYTIGLAFLPNNLTLLNSRAQLFAEMEKYPEAINDYT